MERVWTEWRDSSEPKHTLHRHRGPLPLQGWLTEDIRDQCMLHWGPQQRGLPTTVPINGLHSQRTYNPIAPPKLRLQRPSNNYHSNSRYEERWPSPRNLLRHSQPKGWTTRGCHISTSHDIIKLNGQSKRTLLEEEDTFQEMVRCSSIT